MALRIVVSLCALWVCATGGFSQSCFGDPAACPYKSANASPAKRYRDSNDRPISKRYGYDQSKGYGYDSNGYGNTGYDHNGGYTHQGGPESTSGGQHDDHQQQHKNVTQVILALNDPQRFCAEYLGFTEPYATTQTVTESSTISPTLDTTTETSSETTNLGTEVIQTIEATLTGISTTLTTTTQTLTSTSTETDTTTITTSTSFYELTAPGRRRAHAAARRRMQAARKRDLPLPLQSFNEAEIISACSEIVMPQTTTTSTTSTLTVPQTKTDKTTTTSEIARTTTTSAITTITFTTFPEDTQTTFTTTPTTTTTTATAYAIGTQCAQPLLACIVGAEHMSGHFHVSICVVVAFMKCA
ncbi:hypothetical protein C8R46DRAFT_1047219 [Mycena filopes]|nr:hypothetical protein C8R46DRAFT_1047219 [Mycena filopes]